MPGRLEGKAAIITGGGSGFGAHIAQKFVSEGASVLITDINEANGQKIAAGTAGLKFFKMDVTQASDWKACVEHALKEFGKVDILINNAGISYSNKPTEQVTEAEFEKVFSVNVKSIFHSVGAVVPAMKKNDGKGGSIINIASTGASRPRPGLVWYNSTKGAVVNATKGLAAEYGKDKIRVNSVAPLLTGTALFKTFVGVDDTPENRKQFEAQVPIGRLGETEDVANACVYLASDESAFVTGTNLKVDGGKCI